MKLPIHHTDERQLSDNVISYFENKDSLTGLLEDFPVPLVFFDQSGKILFINKLIKDKLGFTIKDIPDISTWWLRIYPDETLRKQRYHQYREHSAKAEAGHPFEPIDAEIRCKDGHRRFFQYHQQAIGAVYLGIFVDLTHHQDVAFALKKLTEAAARKSGEDLYRSISIALSETLHADYTRIGQLDKEKGGTIIRTLAATADGKTIPNFSYNFQGTPCEYISNNGLYTFPSDVTGQFPDMPSPGSMVQGYAGIPIISRTGDMIGIVASLFRNPISAVKFTESVLQVSAIHVGKEIERRSAEKDLKYRIGELQRWYELTLGREERIQQLKNENEQLKAAANIQPERR